jgi:ribulose kinase
VLVPQHRVGIPNCLIVQNNFKQLGGDLVYGEGLMMTAGLPIGTGLHKQAVGDLGLLEGTPVGSAVIDA